MLQDVLHRLQEQAQEAGHEAQKQFADALKDAAHAEAAADGMEFEQFKTKLSERLQGAKLN